MAKDRPYNRVLLKLSGESLVGKYDYGIDYEACTQIAEKVATIQKEGLEIGLVIGGGNIFRGSHASAFGFERTPADHIGILATCINGLAMQQVLNSMGCKVRVMSARNFDGIIEPYNWTQAKVYLSKGVVVIFVGGTGNPYFTTDTAAALRASEMQADVLVKATKVDGVYDKDPMQFKDAKRFTSLTYEKALHLNIQVMDGPALALCRGNDIPIRVVSLFDETDLLDAVLKGTSGTVITK